ncbi:MFS transporter [Amycolatopsis ultiminotia]|uniref:MFS transporter n=1 Tax=Amycolatopsis ultiminotia TaxID=543629 RepID=A0ABP6W3U6_9PSEU
MTEPSAGRPATRWTMLGIISLGFVTLTLNWFDVATAFGAIGAEFDVGLDSLTLLISLFIIGYGLAHVPGGMLATAIGMKRTLVIGLAVQGLSGVLSGLSTTYPLLAVFRTVSGIGGSIFIAVAFAAVIVWFRDGPVTLALGITGGAAFSGGAAFALYVWIYLQRATGWHLSLIIAGLLELLVAGVTLMWFRTPAGAPALTGTRFDPAALRAALVSRDLWLYGIALMGGYGAYFTTSQVFTEYATEERGFPPTMAGLLSALIALAGIPGSVLGGLVADRTRNLRAIIVGSLLTCAVFLALIPVVPTGALWALGIGIGASMIFGFAAWSAVPARVTRIAHEHLGTATGLMLTLAGVGGFFVPLVFGHLVPATGFRTGWFVLAAVSLVFALVGVFGRNAAAPTVKAAPTPVNTVGGTW